MVKKILEVTKEVTLDDLYKAWWKYEKVNKFKYK